MKTTEPFIYTQMQKCMNFYFMLVQRCTVSHMFWSKFMWIKIWTIVISALNATNLLDQMGLFDFNGI